VEPSFGQSVSTFMVQVVWVFYCSDGFPDDVGMLATTSVLSMSIMCLVSTGCLDTFHHWFYGLVLLMCSEILMEICHLT
jgi:hypothetical protein